MSKSFASIVMLAVLGCVSVAWGKSPIAAATPKDVQCPQSACTTKCDVKGEKCLVTCDEKRAGNNCKESFYRISPFGVLEVTPQRGSPEARPANTPASNKKQ